MAYGGEDIDDRYYSDDSSYSRSRSYSSSDSYSLSARSESEEDEQKGRGEHFYVTRESQENVSDPSRKYSYAGMRDLTALDKIEEKDIVGADGSVRGVKNRVRAGLANYENKEALEKVSVN